MPTISVLRVFANPTGDYGNPVGVVVDTNRSYDAGQRQHLATSSGFSETVFINDLETKSINIFTPQQEIPFAGHAVVGAVSFLERHLQMPVKQVLGSEGPIDSWSEGELTWVKAELRITPPWWHERLHSSEDIEELRGPQSDNQAFVQLWAWINEEAGLVRSRTFAPAWGIPEDEANGSGCMRLAAALGRTLTIHHGMGSVIYARPSSPGYAEIGGRVAMADDLEVS